MIQESFAGNYEDKYFTKNPVARLLIDRFINHIKKLIGTHNTSICSIMDVGCGEGHLTAIIKQIYPGPVKACDSSNGIISLAKKLYGNTDIEFYTKSIYDLDGSDKADLLMCCEVMEHLEEPQIAIERLSKISNKYCLLTVPLEPFWRMLNMLRFKYLGSFGNTPGHIQHWTYKGFYNCVSKYFDIEKSNVIFPWIIIFAKSRI